MIGRVCPKHEEWCPTGECRWCAPEPVKVPPAPEVPSFAKAAQAMIDAARARALAAPLVWVSGVNMLPCKCGTIMLSDPASHYDDPFRLLRHTASACGPPVFHYPACPIAGIMDPNPAKDLAAGCTCVPFP